MKNWEHNFPFSTITVVRRSRENISDRLLDFAKCFANIYIDNRKFAQSATCPASLKVPGIETVTQQAFSI
jgi:hypothetical protein